MAGNGRRASEYPIIPATATALRRVVRSLWSGMAEKSAEQMRKERLARQLRNNLKRRKAQARGLARLRSKETRPGDKGGG